jgi:hypothetical protein
MHGGAITTTFVFDVTTTDSDPGAGKLRLSDTTQADATTMRVDDLASDTSDWSDMLASLAASTSTTKGSIRLTKLGDPTKWIVFNLSAVTPQVGYTNLTVASISESAFGLQCGIYTNSLDLTMSAIKTVRTGGVIVNGT